MRVLLFCALLLLPSVAWAIPVAGNYAFQAGPDIAGTFTSTGTALSAWSFQSSLAGFDLAWSRETDTPQFFTLNTDALFITATVLAPADGFGFYGQIAWNPDPLATHAVFRIDGICCDHDYRDGPPTVAFALAGPTQSVPEPDTLWLLWVGFVGVLFFACRLQARRDLA